jgi:DNA-binding GntR family transcriptional regulator
VSAAATVTAASASLAERAYRDLETLLVTLELAPGALVLERELVEALDIGRTPVREAIQKLAGHGILRVLPRKGLMVSPVRRSELGEVVEARRVLERMLVVKSAERADADQRRALDMLAAHLDSAGEDAEGFFRLDARLDELLEAACGNRYLVRALAPLHIHCRRLWYMSRHRLDLAQARWLHAGLARSVAEADGSGAVRALNGIIATLEHLVSGLDTIS